MGSMAVPQVPDPIFSQPVDPYPSRSMHDPLALQNDPHMGYFAFLILKKGQVLFPGFGKIPHRQSLFRLLPGIPFYFDAHQPEYRLAKAAAVNTHKGLATP